MTVEKEKSKDDLASSSIKERCVFCCETCYEKAGKMAHKRKYKSRLGRKTSKRCSVKRSEMTKKAPWYGTVTGLEKGEGYFVVRMGP